MIKPDDEWGVQIAPLVNALKPAAVEKTQAGYQDWPFAILFVVNIGVISILMATWGVKAVENNDDLDDLLSGNDMKAVVGIASGLAVIAMFLALMMTKVIASYARGVIMFVLVFNLVAAVAVAVIGIAIADMFLTTIGVVIAALSYCYVRSVKPRIPLAVAHLRVAAAATAKSESIYAVSLVFAIVQCVWVVVWGLALLGVAYKIAEKSSGTTSDESAGKTSRGTSWPYFFLLLSFYWGVQVFKNIVHTTVAGTVATFWYHTESASAVSASLKRAMTTSFGSICFGSLVVAILQTLHATFFDLHQLSCRVIMASSEEEYDFDYSDEDEDMEDAEAADLHVQIENAYYSAKQLLEGEPPQREAALEALGQVLALQTEQSDWGFKALKRTVKLLFELQRHDAAMRTYEELLGYTKTAVTRNVGEKGINSILDFVSTSKSWDVLQKFYETTLETLKEARNERLWFKTSVKLGNLLYEIGDFSRLSKIIKELLASCSDEDADDGVRKNSQLLEVYALQIQMYTAQKDNKKLVSIYEKALRTKSGVAHPKIIGVIHECGGKMYMMQREWDKARSDFFSGFKSYDEAGEPRRLQCLKYLVLANMLSESQVNVFDSQEAKPYENDKEIVAMTKLTDAFLRDEIKTFEQVLIRNQEAIMDDPFIKHYIDSLLRTIRSKVLLKIVKPYRTMDTLYIARELNGIPISEVESLLSALVLDKKIEARIDQVRHTLVLLDRKPEEKFQTSIQSWCDAFEKFHLVTLDRISTGM
ncbi:hypothetical protein PRIC2_008077 [Phytophthora ramorum]